MPSPAKTTVPRALSAVAALTGALILAACGAPDIAPVAGEPTASRTTSSPDPEPTTTKPAPKRTEDAAPPKADDLDPRYRTCKEANANGYGPYKKGVDPEYDWYIDRDKDGLACER